MKQPIYTDYIKFMEKQGYLEDVGSSDDLTEIALNEIVRTLIRKGSLEKDHAVEIGYAIITHIEGKFKYYVDCIAAQSFEFAVGEVAEIDKEVSSNIFDKIFNEV